MGYRVRVPTVGDANALGRVHVRAWQAAYRDGLMPDDYLDALSEAERAAQWRERLGREPEPRSSRLVAVAEDGAVVGFVLVGPADEGPDADTGEVHALNVDPEHWGQGAGCDLLAWGVEELAASGFTRAVLWVHPGNKRARRFYEVHSWRDDALERRQEVLGVTVTETRYSRALA